MPKPGKHCSKIKFSLIKLPGYRITRNINIRKRCQNRRINDTIITLCNITKYNTFILKRVPTLRNHHFNHEILFEYFFFFIKRRIYFLISSTKWEATLHFYFTKTF